MRKAPLTVPSMYWFWFFSSSGNMSCCNWRSRNKVPANESVLSKELVLVGGKQRTRQQTDSSLLHRKRLEAQRSSGSGNRRGGGLFSLSHMHTRVRAHTQTNTCSLIDLSSGIAMLYGISPLTRMTLSHG